MEVNLYFISMWQNLCHLSPPSARAALPEHLAGRINNIQVELESQCQLGYSPFLSPVQVGKEEQPPGHLPTGHRAHTGKAGWVGTGQSTLGSTITAQEKPSSRVNLQDELMSLMNTEVD